ncbi:MAG: lysophospholipase [Treponema sp.]|jgi:esterase/lipase|nr:lysophospholipase [Treponema sp.]
MKKLLLTILIILLIIVISCKSINNIKNPIITNNEKYFETSVFPVKGIIIVAHGLNTNPLKMGDEHTNGTLVKLFLDEGYNVYRVILSGHEGAIEEMQSINAQDWIDSALIQYREVAEIAYKNNIPIYLTAFSLGGLVFENLIHYKEDVNFTGTILFAPAIAIKGTARAGIFISDIFLADNAIIKSKAPVEYRAQKGVSISAYNALFELEDNLYKNEFENCNIPTLVFIDPNDELINVSKLQKSITNFNLSNWNVATISNTGTEIKPKYHHLIIDCKCVSSETWNVICERIKYFLEAY